MRLENEAYIHETCPKCGGECDGEGIQHKDGCPGGDGGEEDDPTEPSKPTDPTKPSEPEETEPTKPSGEDKNPDGIPNTGDNSHMALWLGLMAVALIVALVLIYKLKRRK